MQIEKSSSHRGGLVFIAILAVAQIIIGFFLMTDNAVLNAGTTHPTHADFNESTELSLSLLETKP